MPSASSLRALHYREDGILACLFKYLEHDVAKGGSDCGVCAMALDSGHSYFKLGCGCEARAECQERWLAQKATCPACAKPVDVIRGELDAWFRSRDSDVQRATAPPDPVGEHIAQVRVASTVDELHDAIWPKGLFDGAWDEKELANYAAAQLEHIDADGRTHREISADDRFDQGLYTPIPVYVAGRSYCFKTGWRHESYELLIDNNLTFLEHRGTWLGADLEPEPGVVVGGAAGAGPTPQLMDAPEAWEPRGHKTTAMILDAVSCRVAEADSPASPAQTSAGAGANVDRVKVHHVHANSHNLPVILAGSPSSRKSSQRAAATAFVTQNKYTPPTLRDRAAYLTEATVKGIQTADEIVNAMATPWSVQSSGLHLLPRGKFCTYLQCEPGDVLAGTGTVHLTFYAFQFKARGQYEACEWKLRPGARGFQKRPPIAFAPERSHFNRDVKAGLSGGLWRSLHRWMLVGPCEQQSHLCCDGQARIMRHIVQVAIAERLDSMAQSTARLNKYFIIKLNFAFSGILRFSVAEMWKAMYSESLAARLRWLRQVSLRGGFYACIAGAGAAVGMGRDGLRALAGAFEKAAPPRAAHRGLQGVDAATREFLKYKTNNYRVFSASDARSSLRNMINSKSLAEQIKEARASFVEAGLPAVPSDVDVGREKKKRGRKVQM
ncbi:unnamed protein product [Prorocentrum cordatum]|uniref:RING-type domain-containing protein n=1 Tax=Prorocentrum cordatum TaxID=2364126 RepID=A0ABN9X0K8_9DINO|nr:unnamed protein product [Polarella glacialis]